MGKFLNLIEVLREVTKARQQLLCWPAVVSLAVLWITTIEILFHAYLVTDLLISYTRVSAIV